MIKNVLEYLEQSAAKSPDKTAVADEHNAFTYQELLDNAQRVCPAWDGTIRKGILHRTGC